MSHYSYEGATVHASSFTALVSQVLERTADTDILAGPYRTA